MTLINIDHLIGRRNGIIKELYIAERGKNDPIIFSWVAERGALHWETAAEDEIRYGSGGGLTKVEALLSACGEVIERYCSSFIDQKLLRGSFNELKKTYSLLDPHQIELFSAQQYQAPQFPFQRFTRESKVEWVEAHSYQNGKLYVPAFLIYLPYQRQDSGGTHAPASSAGLACGPTLKEATEKAILELIERDAFTVFWLNQLSPPSIQNKSPEIQKWMELFQLSNYDHSILDLTSMIGVPVAGVFAFGNSPFGYTASVGLGSALDYPTTLKKALTENALSQKAIYFYRQKNGPKQYRSDFKDVMSFQDHGYLYSTDPSLKQKLNFMRMPGKKALPNPPQKDLHSELIEHMLTLGFEVIVKDLTTPDIAEIGLHVARAIIPGLAQLHGMHAYPFLGCRRLYQPAQVFSWCDLKKRTEEELRHFPPHMLP